MRALGRVAIVMLAALAGWGCASAPPRADEAPPQAAAQLIRGWPQASRSAAQRLIERYGVPDRAEADRLVWYGLGGRKRVAVLESGAGSVDQTIAYPVSEALQPQLSRIDPDLRVSRYGTELTCRSPSEESGYLALNLAREVLEGRLTPAQAQALRQKTMSLRAAGKESPSLQGLLRPPPRKPTDTVPSPIPISIENPLPLRLQMAPDPMLRTPLWRNEPAS